jgi:hypothetical protein
VIARQAILSARCCRGYSFPAASAGLRTISRLSDATIFRFANWIVSDETALSAFQQGRGQGPLLFPCSAENGPHAAATATAMTGSSFNTDYLAQAAEITTVDKLRLALGWLPIAVILMAAAWLLISDHTRRAAANGSVRLAAAAASHIASPLTIGLAKRESFDPSTSEAITPEQPAPVDGLEISSQFWRRGGLGSNALVTMTLRNANDYAVRNIEISCAFARSDGGHLTDRARLIHDTINAKSRKTFARLHVGFVNLNATKANCSVVAASHA